MSDAPVTLASLAIYPVKSCGGLVVSEAMVEDAGLEFDRQWMVVDAASGVFVTQRDLPRMALVQPSLTAQDVVLRAPGMLALRVSQHAVEAPCRARVWRDEVKAYDMGPVAAQWFSDFLGRPLRLVRFDGWNRRLSDRRWTSGIEAENRFTDGYPVLVASTASLAEVNRRLAQRGIEPVTMARFRPNIVLDGLDAHGEDFLDTLSFETPDGPVVLKLVKPCTRCAIPSIDLLTGVQGTEPGDTLTAYRADPRMGGAVTFGMNAVIVDGIGCMLRAGMQGEAAIRF